jgi:hypothetical protein
MAIQILQKYPKQDEIGLDTAKNKELFLLPRFIPWSNDKSARNFAKQPAARGRTAAG